MLGHICHVYSIESAKLYTMANTDRKHKHIVLSVESKRSVLDTVANGVVYSDAKSSILMPRSMSLPLIYVCLEAEKVREFASTLESKSMSGS